MIDPTDPAFPSPFPPDNGYPGISIRTYLAGQALQGFIAQGNGSFEDQALWAAMAADMLIVTLNKHDFPIRAPAGRPH